MENLRIVTCQNLPEADPDEAPLNAALAEAGVHARWLAWDDPAADWDRPIPAVLRTPWNYHLRPDAFLAFCERVASRAPLWNPLDVVRSNIHKSYLLALAERGVPTPPTRLVARGTALPGGVSELGWERLVIKPAVGAGSRATRSFRRGDVDADAHLALLTVDEDALVQPYLEAVEGHGEHSLIWIDGELSHQVRKAPRFADQEEAITGPFPISAEARALATAALAPWADRMLYARVDVAHDAHGQLVVMELELTEPSLFFQFAPGSAQRFVHGLTRRLASLS